MMGGEVVQIMKIDGVGKDEDGLITTLHATANVKQTTGKVKMLVKLGELKKADEGVEFKLVTVPESSEEPEAEPKKQVDKAKEAKSKKVTGKKGTKKRQTKV